MLVEIQVLPRPAGTDDNPYSIVEAAIAVIQGSGLTFEVGALGTTIEGEPDQLWPLLRRIHEACLEAGATSVGSAIKVFETREAHHRTIGELTGKFRQ
jgi:uncharacterized protein YqgV (UPF0045/DUF77 family)